MYSGKDEVKTKAKVEVRITTGRGKRQKKVENKI